MKYCWMMRACLPAGQKRPVVDVTLRVWEDMVHCFPLLAPAFPEASQAWEEIMAFIRERLKAVEWVLVLRVTA